MMAPGTPGCNGDDYDYNDNYHNNYHGTTIKDGSSRYGCDGTAMTTDNNDGDIGFHSDSNAGSSTGDDNGSRDTTAGSSWIAIDDTSDNEKTLPLSTGHHVVDIEDVDDDI
jgi:hypothetical protein